MNSIGKAALPALPETKCDQKEAANWAAQTLALWPAAKFSTEFSAALVETLCEYPARIVRVVMLPANLSKKFQFLPSLKEINDLLAEEVDYIYRHVLHERQVREQLMEREGRTPIQLQSKVKVICEQVKTLVDDPQYVACKGLTGKVKFISKAGDYMVDLEQPLLGNRATFWFKPGELICLDPSIKNAPEVKARVRKSADETMALLKGTVSFDKKFHEVIGFHPENVRPGDLLTGPQLEAYEKYIKTKGINPRRWGRFEEYKDTGARPFPNSIDMSRHDATSLDVTDVTGVRGKSDTGHSGTSRDNVPKTQSSDLSEKHEERTVRTVRTEKSPVVTSTLSENSEINPFEE